MSLEVSCPVFRCDKTSIGKCTGHRRACEGHYCQTHAKGTLCDGCAGLKQAEMKSGYRQMLKSLERNAYSASLTMGVITLFLISLLLLLSAVVCAFLQENNRGMLTVFVITLAVGALGFFGALVWYVMKAREYVRAESIELDLKYPGFYDYYQEYQAKVDEITSSYN